MLGLAALNKHEMILWDVWGVIDDADAELSADELAELLADPDLEQLRVVFEADDVRVPPVIRSVIPPGPVPVEVVLR
ncbi:hypothetical protein OG439_43650 [Amycolatopsis sp. NBC_01307]|uniref:hypothetical protein n=1 Tax=Amycolatopsis sp. NBC_01307 TaxID=2903561 RepID=UPI002E15B9B4|nr:hypothetical protein OG439_43650 [Amycolatopsis sp. NBC_01307]